MAIRRHSQELWERAVQLAGKIHANSRQAVAAPLLVQEMQRCSIAIATYLADADFHAKRTERVRLLASARSSLFELAAQVRVCAALGTIDSAIEYEAEITSLVRLVGASIQATREQQSRS